LFFFRAYFRYLYFYKKNLKKIFKFNDDIDLASKWLDEEAQKAGWTKADKLKDRKASQGSLGFLKEKNSAAIVELNCETDFVAKNEKFEKVLSSITNSILSNLKSEKQKEIVYKNDLLKLSSSADKTRVIGDDLALAIGNLGENIILRRATVFNVPQGQYLGWYLHGADVAHSIEKCKFGKYGALVNFKMNREECKFEPHDIGRQLAQHVVGMKPTSIGELPKEEVQQPSSSSSETETKIEEKNEQKVQLDDGETRLLYQEFLMKPDSRVIDFLKEHKVEVIDFIRFECGEKIDNEPQ